MSSALPPRPNSDTPVKNPDQHLSERTLLEQAAGKGAIEQSKQRFNEEQEAGRKAVEANRQRASQK